MVEVPAPRAVSNSEDRQAMWNRRAAEVLAGGVASLNRKIDPALVFVHAQGSQLLDANGRRYVDYHAGFAPHLLGHNDPGIGAAVTDAIASGWSLIGAGTTPWEVELAAKLQEAVPSLERMQITNTGSEATAHAIRLCRAYTGREDVLMMLGGYNGWHDEVARVVMPTLEQVGPRVCPGEYRWLPLSSGIPDSVLRRLHLVNFNDLESAEYVLRRYPIACVLTEPVLQNVGVVLPGPGFLAGLRELCDSYGVALVFDEVKTGFRSALGGYQSLCGVTPDLSTFGKAVANGYPLGVIGGRAKILDLFAASDPARRVLIAGTYNAHPISCAAALATLERLTADNGAVYRRLETLAARMQAGLRGLFAERGMRATVVRNASAFCVYFQESAPVDWHDILANHDFDLDRRYRLALLKRGIFHFPIPCKQASISAAHSDLDIDRFLEATRDAIAEL